RLRVSAKASTMASTRFICQCCRQPLKLSPSMETSSLEIAQEPAASTLSEPQEAGETLKRGPASEAETDSETLNYKHWRRRRHEEELETLQGELEGLRLEEARLAQELEEVEKNRERVAEDLEAAQAETRMLDQQDVQYWRDYSNLQWQHLDLQDELTSRRNQRVHVQMQQDRLQKTSIFRATFEIRHDGPVGIINSSRLDSLPTVPVSWNEINMAWGHTALLLHALSNKIGLQFQRYRLFPCGNRSYLKSLTGRDGQGRQDPQPNVGKARRARETKGRDRGVGFPAREAARARLRQGCGLPCEKLSGLRLRQGRTI
uniref:Atg6 BARA domain-containing protein n=1 Tax=Suricata suricatta TaxID=37032 RepID=A0A673TAF4_SURSU